MDSEDAATVSRMLVIGDDATVHCAVVAQLRALCGQKAAATAQPLALTTKYYTANVDVHEHEVRGNEPAPALAHEPQEYEAVLCVLDAAREESFLHVSGFLSQLADEPIDVRLVVGSTASTVEKTPAVAQRLERIQAWCVEHEFEFIEVIESDGSAIASGTAGTGSSSNQLLDANEKQGIDRVLEALHCNMWASMVTQPTPRDTSDNGLRELANVTVALATPDEPTKTPVGAPSSNQHDSAAATGNDDNDDDERLQTLLRALEITEAADDASVNGAADSTAAVSKAGAKSNQLEHPDDGDDDDDIDMAEFSALISEVRNVRDGGQALSDEQRRQRAAEVALKLWSFLGADDDESGSESS